MDVVVHADERNAVLRCGDLGVGVVSEQHQPPSAFQQLPPRRDLRGEHVVGQGGRSHEQQQLLVVELRVECSHTPRTANANASRRALEEAAAPPRPRLPRVEGRHGEHEQQLDGQHGQCEPR